MSATKNIFSMKYSVLPDMCTTINAVKLLIYPSVSCLLSVSTKITRFGYLGIRVVKECYHTTETTVYAGF